MDQPPLLEPQPAAPAPPQRTSLAAKLLNVFATPGEVFEEIRDSAPSTANWLVPVLLAVIVGTASALIIFSQPRVLQEMRERQQKTIEEQVQSGKMSQADADKAVAFAEKIFSPAILKMSVSLGSMIISFARVFWWALVLWLMARWFLKSPIGYLKAVEAAGLATMISLLGMIVAMLLTVSFGKQTDANLAMIVDQFDSKNKFHLVLAAANVFAIWLVGVMSSALARLARVPFVRAFMLVLGYWIVWQVFLLLVQSAVQGG